MNDAATVPKRLNLGLQGGGAHGAFTWGVLDRLLAEEQIEIEGICGTSAGAMNAAVLISGHCRDGRAGARAALKRFWAQVGRHHCLVQPFPVPDWLGSLNADWNPGWLWFDALTRWLSPYQLNPMNWHPLRAILEREIDFGALREDAPIRLFVVATHVRTGKARVFQGRDLSTDALLASACLPQLFQAVEIDGEAYWDGGYMGNPALYPLIYSCKSSDILVVQVNPLSRDETPRTSSEIMNRVNEISFNSTLMREMRAIAFVSRLVEEEGLDPTRYKRLRMHLIEAAPEMARLGFASKLNADPRFLEWLHRLGWRRADEWISTHLGRVGVDSTIDIAESFL